jgi:hypothetical protein
LKQAAERIGDGGGRRAMGCPEIGVIGYRSVLGVEALRGDVEKAEALRRDTRDDLGTDAAPRPRLADAKQTACAGDGCENRIGIERLNRAKIDDFDLVAILGEFLGGEQRLPSSASSSAASSDSCSIAL